MARRPRPQKLVDALSFVYLFYVGWVYLSIVLECFGREEKDREAFLLGLTLTYCLGYLGYLFVPAHGPVGFHAQDYAHPLAGGPVFETMTRAVESQGGAIGAFPSLHVGGAVFLCLFDSAATGCGGSPTCRWSRSSRSPRSSSAFTISSTGWAGSPSRCLRCG